MNHSIRALVLSLALAGLLLAQGTQPGGGAAAPPEVSATQPVALTFDQVVQRGDRIVFVGDEMTQQMTYSRAVAAAILSLKPDGVLRFYNGGYDGATAGTAIKWVDGLFELTQPTVVFVCLGVNDAAGRTPLTERATRFETDLTALVRRIKAWPGVRQVVVVTPPALTAAPDEVLESDTQAGALWALTRTAYRVAAKERVGFINIYTHLAAVHESAIKAGGEALTVGGRLLSEEGHVVLASIVLAGIGASVERLDQARWSPLPPRRMQVVRQALAIKLSPVPDLESAQKSLELCRSIGEFDEVFFQLWRLSGRRPTARPREPLTVAAEQAWTKVLVQAKDGYGGGGARP